MFPAPGAVFLFRGTQTGPSRLHAASGHSGLAILSLLKGCRSRRELQIVLFSLDNHRGKSISRLSWFPLPEKTAGRGSAPHRSSQTGRKRPGVIHSFPRGLGQSRCP